MVAEMTTAMSPSMSSMEVLGGNPHAFAIAFSICSAVAPGYHATGLLQDWPSKLTNILRRGTVTQMLAPS
jgi:hypothetical protein